MKQKIFVLLLCVSYSLAQAQTKTSFGVFGGVNLSTYNGSATKNYDPKYKTGFSAGVYTEVGIGNSLRITPELGIIQDGYKSTFQNVDYVTNLLYLRLAPVFSYPIIGDRLRVIAGPYSSLLISAKEKNDIQKTDVKGSYNNLDIGGTAGVRLDVNHTASLLLSYDQGLTNIYTGPNPTPDQKTLNSMVYLRAVIGLRYLR